MCNRCNRNKTNHKKKLRTRENKMAAVIKPKEYFVSRWNIKKFNKAEEENLRKQQTLPKYDLKNMKRAGEDSDGQG